tara:strand:- start:384 stop:1046 length:663 start_codon:yes stop_codon:yes gene_type:complete
MQSHQQERSKYSAAGKPIIMPLSTKAVMMLIRQRHVEYFTYPTDPPQASRGWLAEVYSVPAFAMMGIACVFVQDNHSYSAPAFILRGLHFETPDRGQDKLVRCIHGRIYDVAVDVRRGSPTYGQWVGVALSAENGLQLFLPIGFAHGFVTLEPDCEVTYKCSDTYAPQHDDGIRWDSVGIDWPILEGITPELSEKDKVQPTLAEFDSPFGYDGVPLTPLS